MPNIYSEEFKASALELLVSGMTQKQVSEDLGISKSSLHLWVSKSRAHHHGVEPAEDAAGRAEQSMMLKRIRELEQENEILRRATAYLSQASLKIGQARPK